jgi:hypothetical protein
MQSYFVETMLHLEMVQLAESIVRVKATRSQNLEVPITDPVYFKVNQLKKK